jgi:hypothetical protein
MKMISLDQIKQTREEWVENQSKSIPEKKLYYMSTDDLYKLRKLKRTRQNSKSGSASLDYISMGETKKNFRRSRPDEYVDGETKWDDLVESMKDKGWLESHPALIMISNRRSIPKIRDGHHRLGVAMDLGIKEIPVVVYYVWKSDDQD